MLGGGGGGQSEHAWCAKVGSAEEYASSRSTRALRRVGIVGLKARRQHIMIIHLVPKRHGEAISRRARKLSVVLHTLDQ